MNPGPYPGDQNYVDPYYQANAQPMAQPSNTNLTILNTQFVPRKYELSPNGLMYAKAVYNSRPINALGRLDLEMLKIAVDDVYAVDNQMPPTKDDIYYELINHNFPLGNSMKYKEFRRLLKEISGRKQYPKGTFGFFRNLIK